MTLHPSSEPAFYILSVGCRDASALLFDIVQLLNLNAPELTEPNVMFVCLSHDDG